MKPSPSRGSRPFLVEIGCEEIPAQFLTGAREGFGKALEAALREARLLPAGTAPEQGVTNSAKDAPGPAVQAFATPRRLVAFVPQLLEKQPDQVQEVLGPPVKAAFDAAGNATKAAESFARKNNVPLQDLARVTTPKGEYLAARKSTVGLLATAVLHEILPAVITGLRFSKSMYWAAKSGPRFVRPIRWILALLEEGKSARTVPLEIAGLKAGNKTYGHRTRGREPVKVTGFEDYAEKLLARHVEIDPEKRREGVRKEIKVLLEDLGLGTVPDAELEEWVVNSTEWPRAILGDFDRRFLHLPREVLVTVMRGHQKYFAVQGGGGNLEPRFVAVLNLDGDSKGLIRAGHERVLAARFTDAEFFWDVDQKTRLESREELLDHVTYQAGLGSYGRKVQRMLAVGTALCDQLESHGVEVGRKAVERAIRLSKCDLTTQMVKEFPELQGVVGGLYAREQGEPPEIADAIYDHYLPQGHEDRCPRALTGALVSLADKIDSVVAGFALGHQPTGSSDPFALRRHGNGIIKVLLEFSLPISLRRVAEEAVNGLEIEWRRPKEEVFKSVLEFLGERLRYYLETVRLIRYDTVRAVLAARWDVPEEVLRRAEALEAIRSSQDFEALTIAAKRIKNILAKSAKASDWQPGEVDGGLLGEAEEIELHAASVAVRHRSGELFEAGNFRAALESIAALRPHVDRFFDRVLVMAEDPATRQNRLRLLGSLDGLFSGIANFAEIAAGPANVGASTSRGA